MTLHGLAKLRHQGKRPATGLFLCLGVRAVCDFEIACTGEERPQHLVGLHNLAVAIRHNDWSPEELRSIVRSVVEIKPAFLALLNHVTLETILMVRSDGRLGGWDVTEAMWS